MINYIIDMKPLVRQNQHLFENRSRLFLRLFELQVLRVYPQNRGWCIRDIKELLQNDQMTF